MTEDWKEKLASLAKNNIEDPEEEPLREERAEEGSAERTIQKNPLRVVIDRKGRKGKTATIIEGFEADDEEVAELASELKRTIGTGGSSRGGEILLPGEWKEKVITILKEKGYAAR